MKYQTVKALNGMLEMDVRGMTNRAIMVYEGIQEKLRESLEFSNDLVESMITDYAALVCRVADLRIMPDVVLDELGNDWIIIWDKFQKKQYTDSFELFTEWCGGLEVDNDIRVMWDKAIASASFEISMSDPDLVSPDNLDVPQDDESKKKLKQSA